jgi:hypothetical protein
LSSVTYVPAATAEHKFESGNTRRATSPSRSKVTALTAGAIRKPLKMGTDNCVYGVDDSTIEGCPSAPKVEALPEIAAQSDPATLIGAAHLALGRVPLSCYGSYYGEYHGEYGHFLGGYE